MREPVVAALAALAAAWPAAAPAQQSPGRGSLHVVVQSTLGDRIAYAVVGLEPGFARRFSDDSGTITFLRIAPGTYHLLARQVGYKPRDTTVTVVADSTVTVTAALEHLVVELAEIRVTAQLSRAGRASRCTAPGPPDAERTPELAAIFDQLRQNAERYWMLADSYPASYRMSRRFGVEGHFTRPDTLLLRTDTRWRYAPGHLVQEWEGPHGGTELQVQLPTLPDIADPVFQRNHCFTLIGLDTLGGRTFVRMDFRPDERMTDPDADGSAYLDPATYLIRHVRLQLTHPDRAVVGLMDLRVQMDFQEVAPALVIVERITSDMASLRGQELFQRREEQRLLGVRFLRALPRRQ